MANLQFFLEHWDLIQDGPVLSTHSSILAPAHLGSTPVMLKIVDPGDDESQSWQLLKIYSGRGAVKLLDRFDNALLLQRLIPNRLQPSLEEMVLSGKDDEATTIICNQILTLNAQSENQGPYQGCNTFLGRIQEMLNYLNSADIDESYCPLFDYGHSIALELDHEPPYLLHGDLHHFNILNDQEYGWVATDPKGIWGPRAYEYSAPLCNPTPHTLIVADPITMLRRASIMQERSKLAASLLLHFAFVHALQVAAWCKSPADFDYWIACAQALRKTI